MVADDVMVLLWVVACAVALRWTLFKHGTTKFFRNWCKKLFSFAPGVWAELSACPFCNGFWVSLAVYGLFCGFLSGLWVRVVCLPFAGLVGAYACLIVEIATAEMLDRYSSIRGLGSLVDRE